ASRLGAVNPRLYRGIQEVQLLELLECLVNLADQTPARHGRHDVIGSAPTQVFGDLEANRFRPLCVKRTKVDVNEAPAEYKRNLRTEAVYLIVVAIDRDHLRAVDGCPEHLALFEALGNQHVGVESRSGGVGSHAVREVARRGASHGLKAEFDGLGK